MIEGTQPDIPLRRFTPVHARTMQGQCSAACVETTDGAFVTFADCSDRIAAFTSERNEARADAAALREKVTELEGIISGLNDVINGHTKPLWQIDAELREKFGATIAARLAEPEAGKESQS